MNYGELLDADVAVIGAGFFGCEIALQLRRLGVPRVLLLDREPAILRRASAVNQARVHNGYHYPRAVLTALRARASFDRFLAEYGHAIRTGIAQFYAIARSSYTNATQFERFCATISIPCRPAPRQVVSLFDEGMVEDVFEAREAVFDTTVIAAHMMSKLVELAIDVRLSLPVRLAKVTDTDIILESPRGQLRTRHVVNATYACLDGIGISLRAQLKRELAEVVLVEPPPELLSSGITVIDGPFFSLLPFPPANLHSLTHVRYTPHEARLAAPSDHARPSHSNASAMIRDAARYLPRMARTRAIRSLFEWKTVLLQSEEHDDRPILLETSPMSDRIVSVLGAKIDNIYDVRDAIRARRWDT
jgi:glycine/D-amino acid oxidase-like deaminating enzyme